MPQLNFWIIISFLYPILFAINNIINSMLVNKNFSNPYVLTFYKSITNALFVPLILLVNQPSPPSYHILSLYFILAILDLSYLIPYYKALKNIDASIVTALFSLGRIVMPLLTYIFLDEKLKPIQYLGFTLIIASTIALSSQKIKSLKINKAFYLMVLSSFIHSSFLVLEKHTINSDTSWINLMIYPSIFSTFIPFLLFLSPHLKREIKNHYTHFKNDIHLFLYMELFTFIGLLTISFILPHISAITKVSISSTTPIFVLIISIYFNKNKKITYLENLSKQELNKKLILFLLIGLGTYLVIN